MIRLCGQEIHQPGHICAFFDSREEEYATLLPYLQDGIAEGENVVNVLDAARMEDHRRRLEDAGVATSDERLRIASTEDTYLAGGSFDIERMAGFVRSELEAAMRDNRKVRTVGWMEWIHTNPPGKERVMEYEARMNLLVPDFDCTFMCVYDLARLPGEMVVDLMATHPYVILRGSVRANPFYVPPATYLEELLAKREPASLV